MSNVDKWRVMHGDCPTGMFGSETTYVLGATWLMDCKSIEDWGCGTNWFSRVMWRINPNIYILGLDGSPPPPTIAIDLEKYQSLIRPQGIFMRHVLEHNWNWKIVLQNALLSFEKRMALILFTPFSETTHNIYEHGIDVPVLSFSKEELESVLLDNNVKFTSESLDSPGVEFGRETIYRIER